MSNYYGSYWDDNQLAHYGVLGMKWGIRKAEKRGETYTYKSHGQKKYEKKLANMKKKGITYNLAKTERKYETFKTRDAQRQQYAMYTKTGSAIGRTLLLGPWGNGTYSRMRAAGYNRGISAVSGMLTNTTGLLGVGVSKVIENKTAQGMNVYNKAKEYLSK